MPNGEWLVSNRVTRPKLGPPSSRSQAFNPQQLKEGGEAESRILARLSYSGRALADLERLADFLIGIDPSLAAETKGLIEESVLALSIRHRREAGYLDQNP